MLNDTGELKYPFLTKIVKAALSHGNSHVERGFSMNKKYARSDRSSLSIGTIQAFRQVLDVVRAYEGPCNVPIEKGTIKAFLSARKVYRESLEKKKKRMEEQRARKDEEKLIELQKKRKIYEKAAAEKEEELLKSQEKAQELISSGLKLINEANKVGRRDPLFATNMNLGTGLLNTGNDKLKEITAELLLLRVKRRKDP